jgi:hypothetical protein
MQDVRFGTVPPELFFPRKREQEEETVVSVEALPLGVGIQTTKFNVLRKLHLSSFRQGLGQAWCAREVQKTARAPSGFSPSTAGRAVALSKNVVVTRSPFARMPNPSVNLTRNSGPHLPGMARYAHNALPGKRGPLPRAGYLKR